ncbi:MAG: tRNA (guanosine(46)-N7)-methyltransferase TrmB, partial [Acidobacteria bacterium]|nr:tRNA (guanosine(46)-N7)-methyltransferase TrmB [Acidobacteriota bacterium]
ATGLAILFYFLMHIIVTSLRAYGIYLWTEGNFFHHPIFRFGEFLVSIADKEKDSLFIGIEKYGEGLRKIVAKIKREGIKNIIPLCGDAYVILQVAFKDNFLEKIYVNFPAPWPKKRHQKRRILTEEFFTLSSRKLKEGGKLYFATDDQNLTEFAINEIEKVPQLTNLCLPEKFLSNSPYPAKTRYETKWSEENKKLYYFIFEKKNASHQV